MYGLDTSLGWLVSKSSAIFHWRALMAASIALREALASI